jgi:glycosyltransferase involved in cell wall biosynthesis
MQNLVEMFSHIPNKEAVHFLGTLPHDTLQTEYSKHHVLIITREAGATPRVGIEALAKGMPIVAFFGAQFDRVNACSWFS